MPVGHFPERDDEQDDREPRPIEEIIRDIITRDNFFGEPVRLDTTSPYRQS